jgi:predicted PurR-regulated permease PerM
MKFKILIYLFIFVCVILFFQIINTNKVLNHQDTLIQNQYQKNIQLKESLDKLEKSSRTDAYFSLNSIKNTKELSDLKEVSNQIYQITNQLFAYNTNGKLNKLFPKLSNQSTFLVNHVKLINEEWLLLGLQSDISSCQVLVKYTKNKSDAFEFELLSFFTKQL